MFIEDIQEDFHIAVLELVLCLTIEVRYTIKDKINVIL